MIFQEQEKEQIKQINNKLSLNSHNIKQIWTFLQILIQFYDIELNLYQTKFRKQTLKLKSESHLKIVISMFLLLNRCSLLYYFQNRIAVLIQAISLQICNKPPQFITIINQRRLMNTKISLLLLLLAFTATSLDVNYYKSAAIPNIRSSFQLSYCSSSSIVQITITQVSAVNSYTIGLWRPGENYPIFEPFQIFQHAGSYIFTSQPLDKPGDWRVELLPQSLEANRFKFNILMKVDNRTVGSFTDVSRYQKVFIFYHRTSGFYNATLSVPANFQSSSSFQLCGPQQLLSFNEGNCISSGSGVDQTITYHSNGKQFYYAVLDIGDDLINSAQFIRFQYKTQKFQCPYDQDFTDYNGVFLGCSSTIPTQSFPCINFDNSVGTCLQCQTPWILTEDGVCIQDNNCPDRQYIVFGKCYDAIANCQNFQKFGGLCNSCYSGYELRIDSNGSQTCVQKTPICGSNQYLMGNNCYNYVNNCANFQSSTATCKNCQLGYVLNGNACVAQVQTTISCPLGQSAQNGICIVIDQFCVFYNQNNSCMLCAKGYKIVNGLCSKINCGLRQFSLYGNCTDVSPLCVSFDPIYGNCLTCITSYYLQNDGSCLQGLSAILGKSSSKSSSGCPDGYYSRSGTCVQINPLCATYDSLTGKCTTCKNSAYFLNQNGGCILVSSYCQGRTYFANGNCLPVSVLCDTYDTISGACFTCRDSATLTSDGRCVYNQACGDRQYHTSDGSCAKVSEKCTTYDANNGYCLGCIQNYELNDRGVCCYQYNYMLDSACIQYFKANCASQRPVFNNCVKCNDGYTLTNGVFGRCNAAS